MKNSFLLLLIICFALSCSKDKDENFDIDEYPQKWILVKMSSQVPNSETTGENMVWQEYYALQADGSFIKHREIDGTTYEAAGTFALMDLADDKYLKLTYDKDYEIIGSCAANQTETLRIVSGNKIAGTWLACDGPGLEYEREE